jgi:hypothetical protein
MFFTLIKIIFRSIIVSGVVSGCRITETLSASLTLNGIKGILCPALSMIQMRDFATFISARLAQSK